VGLSSGTATISAPLLQAPVRIEGLGCHRPSATVCLRRLSQQSCHAPGERRFSSQGWIRRAKPTQRFLGRQPLLIAPTFPAFDRFAVQPQSASGSTRQT